MVSSSSTNVPSSITCLPDDCMHNIFQRFDSGRDREYFGLTCRRWLRIQNSSRKSLQFECACTILSISSLSHSNTVVTPFHIFRLLNRFRHLETLSLSGCTQLPDSGLTHLKHFGSKLYSLHLDCCFGITDNGLSSVAFGCPSLTLISLYRCNITDIGLQTLAKSCSGLKDVNLSYCSLISDYGIRSLSQNCHELRALRLSHCNNITGVGFKGCSCSLTYLEADSCKLEPEGIPGIVSGGGLEYLNVSSLNGCTRGDGLMAIGYGFASRLKILNFRLCRTVDDESVMSISKGCPLLEEWNLALCSEVKLLGWKSIGLNCFNLKRLHVNRCRNLCEQGFIALRKGCQRLSVVYINKYSHISCSDMDFFKMLRPDVEIREEEVMCIAPKWAF